MHAFLHAVHVFFHHLAAVHWGALGIALAWHFARLLVRVLAWRNILAAAFPGSQVRRRSVFGAYAAGVGVNSIAPARSGDALRLYLARRAIPDSNYATLGATLLVETLLDLVVAAAFLVWALQLGVLPGFGSLPDLPTVDWTWLLRHPTVGAVFAALLFIGLLSLAAWLAVRVEAFWRRVAQGFAILGDRNRYLRQVASWQALSWVFRVASVWWFLRAFGMPATLHNALLVQVVQSLSTLLPFSPGGAGTQQGLIVYVFRGVVSATVVLSFSVGMNIALTALNVLLGFGAILVTLRTLRWRRLVRPREASAGTAQSGPPERS